MQCPWRLVRLGHFSWGSRRVAAHLGAVGRRPTDACTAVDLNPRPDPVLAVLARPRRRLALLLPFLLLLPLDLFAHLLITLRLLALLLLQLLLHLELLVLLLLQGLALALGFGLLLLLHLQLLLGLLLELALRLLLLFALLGLAPLAIGLGAGRVVRHGAHLLSAARARQRLGRGLRAGLQGGRGAHVGAALTVAALPVVVVVVVVVHAAATWLDEGGSLGHDLHLRAWQGQGLLAGAALCRAAAGVLAPRRPAPLGLVGDGIRPLLVQVAARAREAADRARPACAPGRLPGFARGQRHPSHIRMPHLGARARLRRAQKAHQGRGIAGAAVAFITIRNPAPARPGLHPAPIVEGGKAPGRVVDPGPAPGFDPFPAPVAVGRPVAHGDGGVPHRAPGRVGAPFAPAIELLVADDFARQVARGLRLVFDQVALGHPLVKPIGAQHHRGFYWSEPAATEIPSQALGQGLAGAVLTIGDQAALLHADPGVALFQAHVQAVVAGLLHQHGQVGGVDLDALAG